MQRVTKKPVQKVRVAATASGATYWRYGDGPEAFGVHPGRVTFDIPGRFDVTVEVDHCRDSGRPEATSLTVRRRDDGPPIGSRSVAREAHLGGLVRAAVTALSFPSPEGTTMEAWRGRMLGRRAAEDQLRRLYGHDRGGRGPDEDRAALVKKAAAAYRRAQAKGAPTGRAVQAAVGYGSPSFARKLVAEARSEGLLTAAKSTRPKLGDPEDHDGEDQASRASSR